MATTACGSPLILFGAFDRHNAGDLLFPHIASALLPQEKPVMAGLVQRDLRRVGGHAVQSIRVLAQRWKDTPLRVLHAGGELLTCHAWEAAVMLLPPSDACQLVNKYDDSPAARQDWTSRFLGTSALAPYVLSRERFPCALKLMHHGVGGVNLDRLPAAMQAEVADALGQADFLTVRDRQTLSFLQQRGIDAALVPDPVVLLRELFAARIAMAARNGEAACLAKTCRKGYIAVQCSADFCDDATLDRMARQLDQIAVATGMDMVLFRMGAAPWHDDPGVYRRLASRMRRGTSRIAESLDVWDICALIAQSRGFCGSSLHGRIIASAYALPRATIRLPENTGHPDKHEAYVAAWEFPDMPGPVAIDQMAEAFLRSCDVPVLLLRQHARFVAGLAFKAFAELSEQLA